MKPTPKLCFDTTRTRTRAQTDARGLVSLAITGIEDEYEELLQPEKWLFKVMKMRDGPISAESKGCVPHVSFGDGCAHVHIDKGIAPFLSMSMKNWTYDVTVVIFAEDPIVAKSRIHTSRIKYRISEESYIAGVGTEFDAAKGHICYKFNKLGETYEPYAYELYRYVHTGDRIKINTKDFGRVFRGKSFFKTRLTRTDEKGRADINLSTGPMRHYTDPSGKEFIIHVWAPEVLAPEDIPRATITIFKIVGNTWSIAWSKKLNTTTYSRGVLVWKGYIIGTRCVRISDGSLSTLDLISPSVFGGNITIVDNFLLQTLAAGELSAKDVPSFEMFRLYLGSDGPRILSIAKFNTTLPIYVSPKGDVIRVDPATGDVLYT